MVIPITNRTALKTSSQRGRCSLGVPSLTPAMRDITKTTARPTGKPRSQIARFTRAMIGRGRVALREFTQFAPADFQAYRFLVRDRYGLPRPQLRSFTTRGGGWRR